MAVQGGARRGGHRGHRVGPAVGGAPPFVAPFRPFSELYSEVLGEEVHDVEFAIVRRLPANFTPNGPYTHSTGFAAFARCKSVVHQEPEPIRKWLCWYPMAVCEATANWWLLWQSLRSDRNWSVVW